MGSGSSLLKGKSGLMEGCGPALGRMGPARAQGGPLSFKAYSAFREARAASRKRTCFHFKEDAHRIKGNLDSPSKGEARPFSFRTHLRWARSARRCFRRWSATVTKMPLDLAGRGLGMLPSAPQPSGQVPGTGQPHISTGLRVGNPDEKQVGR